MSRRERPAAFGDQIGDSLSSLKPFRVKRVFPQGSQTAESVGLIITVLASLRLIPSGHHPDIGKWRSTSVRMLVLRLREITPFFARGIDAPISFYVRSLHKLAL
jgi:hypothetical protein